jgi:hypothetical protein
LYLHRELTGIGSTFPLSLKRYEIERSSLPGTGLVAYDQMYDASGNLVDFYVDQPRLMVTGGGVFIRHKGTYISSEYPNSSYAMYANARVCLAGPSSAKATLPSLDWLNPPPSIALSGKNILGVQDHYANPGFSHQRVLQPGYYRLEYYASAGTDALDVDSLAELPDYNQHNLHQYWARVY